jgi:hypothetical protein
MAKTVECEGCGEAWFNAAYVIGHEGRCPSCGGDLVPGPDIDDD